MRQFKRSQRLGEQMLRDISELLRDELADFAPGLVTFTRVRLTDDLRYARVYYSYLGTDEDLSRVEGYLERERKRIRSEVGRQLRVRNIPEVTFKFDPSVEEGIRIGQLLDEIKDESASE